MFVKHVCGKPRLRFPYYLTSDLLVIDLTGNSLNNQALSGTRCTFVLREKGEELWACQFDEYVPMSESLAVRLLPETEGNTYRGAEYDGVARNMWEVIYGHLPIG